MPINILPRPRLGTVHYVDGSHPHRRVPAHGACGVRNAIHGADPELIVKSCETSSGLTTIQRQCAIFLCYSFIWS